jgi:hypothetical protein
MFSPSRFPDPSPYETCSSLVASETGPSGNF